MKKLFIALLSCSPVLSYAHGASGHGVSFAEGFWHPLSGLDHMLALVAGGIWLGGMISDRRSVALLVFAGITLVAGVVAGALGLPPQKWAVVATLVVLPVFLVVSHRWHSWFGAALMAAAAGVHASVHGAELGGLTHGVGDIAGALLGTVCSSLAVLSLSSTAARGLRASSLRRKFT